MVVQKYKKYESLIWGDSGEQNDFYITWLKYPGIV